MRARREDIAEAVIARVYAVSDPGDVADSVYLDGLLNAIHTAIDYGLESLDSTGRLPPVSVNLLAQARLAARNGVTLDTVFRRYLVGYTVLGDFVVEEGAGLLGGSELKQVLRSQAALLDRLLAAVSAEHARETRSPRGSEQHPAEFVKRLLAGELLSVSGESLNYDVEASHLGALAKGVSAETALRRLASDLGCRLLLVRPDPETIWVWLASVDRLDAAVVMNRVASTWPADSALALGEPGDRIAGWRQTHRQAAAALPIALRRSPALARYSEAALLATALQDDLLSTSLRRLFLDPLQGGRQGGEIARQTLRAYAAAERNVSSTAASLRVKRHTVTNRLREIEAAIGLPLGPHLDKIELALRLEELLATRPLAERVSGHDGRAPTDKSREAAGERLDTERNQRGRDSSEGDRRNGHTASGREGGRDLDA